MTDQPKKPESNRAKIIDILLGGLGGALVSSIVAVFLGQYFSILDREKDVNLQTYINGLEKQIIESEKKSMNLIRENRKQELEYIYEAMKVSEEAKQKAIHVSSEFDALLSDIKRNETLLDKIVANVKQGFENKAETSLQQITSVLKSELMNNYKGILENQIIAVKSEKCPEGWLPYKELAGRVILGAGQGSGLQVRNVKDSGGDETSTLGLNNLPPHKHEAPFGVQPSEAKFGQGRVTRVIAGAGVITHKLTKTSSIGEAKEFSNMPPFYVLQFCEREPTHSKN